MKDILLKHGISCDLLTKEQSDKFSDYKTAVCENNTEMIVEEIHNYLSFCRSREADLSKLREKVRKELKLLQSEIEGILPRADESVLAAFLTVQKKDLEPNHVKLVQVLATSSLSFDSIANEYLCFFSLSDIRKSLEARLLWIAIKEYGKNTKTSLNSLNEYDINAMGDFSIRRGDEILKLKERFLVFSLMLDDAFQRISKSSPSIAPYLSCARELLSFLHKEELLNEQKRYKNE